MRYGIRGSPEGNRASLFPGFSFATLTKRFKKTDSRGHADIEAFHLSPHGNLNEKITLLLRQAA